MKLYLANDSKQGLGGGWTFMRNLAKSFEYTKGLFDIEIVDSIIKSDICLISGATMVSRDTYDEMKALKKKVVVRLDNVPRNSRNRNTGTSRLQEFSQRADEVVWQCEWARNYLGDFIGREGKIIYNGVDTHIFNPNGKRINLNLTDAPVFLYSRFNRDETKMWEAAWYEFQMVAKDQPNAMLLLVGQFSPEQIEYKFDFFRAEKVSYLGVVDDPEVMASIYRASKYLLATYYNDCYSNTYQEALACGVELYKPNMSGGTPELIKNGVIPLETMASQYYDLFKEVLSK